SCARSRTASTSACRRPSSPACDARPATPRTVSCPSSGRRSAEVTMADFDFTIGTARVDLSDEDVGDIERREAAQLLVRDERRVRPRYHDGRFLTAADLTREQL